MTLQANARNLLEDKMPGHMFVETLQLITFSSVSQKLKGGGRGKNHSLGGSFMGACNYTLTK